MSIALKYDPDKPKGTKGNPFYELIWDFDPKGILLRPVPLLNNGRTRGPALELASYSPAFISRNVPTKLLYTSAGPMILDYMRRDVIKLALEIEMEANLSGRYGEDLNAFLLLNPIYDKRICNRDDAKKAGIYTGGYWYVLPVAFFHIDVALPKDLKKMTQKAREFASLGLTLD